MLLAKNRKALYDHEITEKFISGIKLQGYEVKAIKERKVNFDGSYVLVIDKEAFVVNMHIGMYSTQSQKVADSDSRKTRKLLLNKNEIKKLQIELSQKGKTAVPLALLLDHGLVKLEFAVVKGRKKQDKRLVEKQRQIQRDMEREIKEIARFM